MQGSLLNTSRLLCLVGFTTFVFFLVSCEQPASESRSIESPQTTPLSTTRNSKVQSESDTAPRDWSPEMIAADPEAFCRWASNQLEENLAKLNSNKLAIQEKLGKIELSKKAIDDNIEEVSNLSARASAAHRRAEDEERWPAVFAGKSFSKSELVSLIEATTEYTSRRKPLINEYARAAQRLKLKIRQLDEQASKIRSQMEIVILDLERIKIAKELNSLPEISSDQLLLTGITNNLARESSDELMKLDIEDLTTIDDSSRDLDYFLGPTSKQK